MGFSLISENMDLKIVAKILKGEASEQEKNGFFNACEANPELKEEYIRLKNLWALSIEEQAPNKQKSFEQFWATTRRNQSNRLRRIVFEVAKYAAILVVSFGLALFVNSKFSADNDFVHTFSSEMGSISSIELNDGSKIWLNSGSQLHFTEKSKKRVVASLSGEAYFEIVHNPGREFLIDVDMVRIRDLGTKFNVKAYAEDDQITATLLEGKIDVQSTTGESLIEMNPSDHFSFHRLTNKYQLDKIDPSYAVAWKDGKFVFIDKNLREICNELEKWYDVQIVISNPELESEKYTSILKRTTVISHVLEMLRVTTGLKYEIKTKTNGPNMILIK